MLGHEIELYSPDLSRDHEALINQNDESMKTESFFLKPRIQPKIYLQARYQKKQEYGNNRLLSSITAGHAPIILSSIKARCL